MKPMDVQASLCRYCKLTNNIGGLRPSSPYLKRRAIAKKKEWHQKYTKKMVDFFSFFPLKEGPILLGEFEIIVQLFWVGFCKRRGKF